MPKKQNNKPQSTPAHRGRMRRRTLLLSVILGIFGVALIAACVAQVIFNRYVWDRLEENASLKITLLIVEALEGLDELKSTPEISPDGSLLISEARLKLPPMNDDVNNIVYQYTPKQRWEDENGQNKHDPAYLQITTKQISRMARVRLLSLTTADEVFRHIPEAHACNRGFTIKFELEENAAYHKSITLQDGREMYLYREPECSRFAHNVDQLEAYLLQAKSY